VNLAHNKLGSEGIGHLVQSLGANRTVHALLLGGNPGFGADEAGRLSTVTADVALRLELMPRDVAVLLQRWMRLQLAEMAQATNTAAAADDERYHIYSNINFNVNVNANGDANGSGFGHSNTYIEALRGSYNSHADEGE
jgi:hypothetical protein